MGAPSKTFVVFASGVGTNAEVLIGEALARKELLQPIALLSDRDNIGALKVAEKHQVPATIAKSDEEILLVLRKLKPDWAFLMGYKKLLSKPVLDFFYDSERNLFRILNVHPSLLPAYPGLNGYRRAFEDGVRLTGVTVHFVDAGLDTGIPLLQKSFPRMETDTFELFVERAKAIEHELVKKALSIASENQFQYSRSKKEKFIYWETRK